MSLLTEDAKAWVGRQITFESDPISVSDARCFVAASGDDNPAYALPEIGQTADGSPCPPMLYYGATRPWAPADQFNEDGTVAEHRPMIGKGQTMGGRVEMEWLAPLRVGDRLKGTRTLAALTEKHGKRFDFVLAEWITEYRDQSGVLKVRERYEQILF